MKRLSALLLALSLCACLLTACNSGTVEITDDPADFQISPEAIEEGAGGPLSVITIGASPAPHTEILEAARTALNELGYDLNIVEYNDYVVPNVALNDGDLDANFFQHQPYLDNYNAENGTELATLVAVHYEPLGIYAGKTASLAELADGAQIAVPNDGTNEARALKLLEANGLITLDPDANFTATVLDIADNPKNLNIVEMEAAQIPRALADLDLAVINGNYAIDAGLNVETDALAKEEKESDSASAYANIVAIRAGDESRAELIALAEVLTSDAMRQFIEETYSGAVVAIF